MKLRIREVTVGPVAIVAAVIAVGALAGGLSVALGGPATTGVASHVGGGPGTLPATPPSTGASTGGRKTTTSLAPTAPASTTPKPTATTTTVPFGTSGAQGTQYIKVASADAAAYAADAWCSPLESASGHSLAALETSVASGVNRLSSISTPAMVNALSPSLGQIAPSPLARPTATSDLATATALVPVSANPSSVTLRTEYCYSAIAPLTSAEMTAQGGVASLVFEAAYGLGPRAGVGHMSWWHVWWSTSVVFGPCGQSICMTGWKLPGASVSYWASPQRSTAPRYVVPALDGAWDLSYPPG